MKAVLVTTLIASLLTLTARPVQATPPAPPAALSAATIPCPMPLPAGEVDGETIICGQIEVPENWDNPSGRTITITYARQVSRNLSPIADPILFFAGGPGGSVLASQGSFGFDFSYLRETRDVIVWDQRGNRYSSDLRCPLDVQWPDYAAQEAEYAELGPFEVTLQQDPQAIRDYTRQALEIIEGTARCDDYFAAQGIDLAQYNTANTVRDAIALMHHLAHPAYNLFGISYGTQVTLAIADYYESHDNRDLPPIRSALIDGVYPVNLAAGDEILVAPYNILRIFAECEADDACGVAYPGVRQTLIDLLTALEAAPLMASDGSTVTLADLSLVLQTAVRTKNVLLITYLPRMVAELAQGEPATYAVAQAILAGQVQPATDPQAGAAPGLLDPITVQTSTLARELRTIAGRLDTLGAATGDLGAAIDEAATLPDLSLGILNLHLEALDPGERSSYSNAVTQLYVIHPDQQTRQGLLALAGLLPDTVGGELIAIANLLSDIEVRQVWSAVTDDRTLQTLDALDMVTNAVVKCNDLGPVFDTTRAIEALRAFDAPQLVDELSIIASYEARCDIYGIGAGDYAVRPPVSTDLPMLVMNGGLDHATPVEWGELAFQSLTNAKMVNVPMTDHGVTRYSKCAKDIAHTFFLYPEAELNTSCIEAFRPAFVLPDDALPTMGGQ